MDSTSIILPTWQDSAYHLAHLCSSSWVVRFWCSSEQYGPKTSKELQVLTFCLLSLCAKNVTRYDLSYTLVRKSVNVPYDNSVFLLVVEDLERNDGSAEKPYFMSKDLRKILGKKNVISPSDKKEF